jgi:hypothetical protein
MNIYARQDTSKIRTETDLIFDNEWLKSTFILGDKDIVLGDEYSKWVRKNRYFSSADFKFTSTSPGMNIACNPKPQFTRYCDIRSIGKLYTRPRDITLGTTGHEYGLGMGRYYSEAIDDNQQRIYLRFGVPQFTPLTVWLNKSFNIEKVVLQNRGVIASTLISSVAVLTKIFTLVAAPLLTIGMTIFNTLVSDTRFYTVKSTMYIYWATVENILNSLVTRRTLIPYVLQDYSNKLDNIMNKESKPSSGFIQDLNSIIPDVIDGETGRISVFALALRAQAAYNRVKSEDIDRHRNMSLTSDFTGYAETGNIAHDTYFTNRSGGEFIFSAKIFKSAYDLLMKDDKENSYDPNSDDMSQSKLIDFDTMYTDNDGNPINMNIDPSNPNDSAEARIAANVSSKKDKWSKYKEYVLSELSEGAAFAVFNVESTGSVGESFSNSFGANPLESSFNSLSSTTRRATDLLSSATSIPVVGDAMKLAADVGATILSNASYGIANPLLALAYGVHLSFPKIWETSSASLPRASYKIKLISPYGNAYSQLFNIYMPLSMILAASLPRSTGGSTYTSPFLCQLFDRGRVNIQLGMIDNVSITRGTSNLAFTRSGHPNSIDVSLDIANLDEVISVDVSSSGVIGKVLNALNEPLVSDNPFTTYINTITGLDMYHQVYRIPMIRLKLAERMANIKAVIDPDPAAYAAMTVNKFPLSGLGKFMIGENQAALQDLFIR